MAGSTTTELDSLNLNTIMKIQSVMSLGPKIIWEEIRVNSQPWAGETVSAYLLTADGFGVSVTPVGEIRKKIWSTLSWQEQKKILIRCKLQLSGMVKMLQLIRSLQISFIIIAVMDWFMTLQLFRLFYSLKETITKSPGVQNLLTGRPHTWADILTCLAG